MGMPITDVFAVDGIASQSALACAYYAGLVVLTRLSGKRLAGQTTTFDLIVLISLSVVIQNATLRPGSANAVVFVVAAFAAHRIVSAGCARSEALRHLVRGAPRLLVRDGKVLTAALRREGLTQEELLAGLRRLGIESVEAVRTATLEETGHISAIEKSS
jgi:uncharacterized membrane protein YcaP (DUF421 family)